MADETDPVLDELLRQQSPFQQFKKAPNPFEPPKQRYEAPVGTEADLDSYGGYVPEGVNTHPAAPSALTRLFGWLKGNTPESQALSSPIHGERLGDQVSRELGWTPEGSGDLTPKPSGGNGILDKARNIGLAGGMEADKARAKGVARMAMNTSAVDLLRMPVESGHAYSQNMDQALEGQFGPGFKPEHVLVPPQMLASLAHPHAFHEGAPAGEGFKPSVYSSAAAKFAEGTGIHGLERSPDASGGWLERNVPMPQPKTINIWPGEENLTPGYPANKIDQNPLTPGAAMSRRLLQEHLGVTHFPKPPALEGIIDRLPGALDKQALETAGKEVTGRTRDNDASINHRVLKAEGDNKVGALISTQDIMRQLEDLKLQGTPRVSGGGTTYIRVNDPINPDTPSLKVRVPPPDNLHGGKPNYREIDTSIEGTRHLHAGQTNAARQPYQGDIGRVRKALEFAFGRNLVSPGEEPGFTRYKTETQPPQPKELPNPDQMKLLARGDKHLMFGGSLGSHTEIGTKMPDADFWITRRGADGKLGEVSKEYNPESFGVLNRNHAIDPDYLRYALEHVKNQGYYAGRGHGTTNLKNIRLKDVEDIPIQPSDFRLDAKGGDLRSTLAAIREDPAKKLQVEQVISATRGTSHSAVANVMEKRFGIPKTGERWWEAKDWGMSGRPLKRYYGDTYGAPIESNHLRDTLGRAVQSFKDNPPAIKQMSMPSVSPWLVPEKATKLWETYDKKAGHIRETAEELGIDRNLARKLIQHVPRPTPQSAEAAAAEAARKRGAGLGSGRDMTPEQRKLRSDYQREYQRAKRAGETPKTAAELDAEGKLGVERDPYQRGDPMPRPNRNASNRIFAPDEPKPDRPARVDAAGEARRQGEASEEELAKRNGKPFWDEQGRAEAQQKDLEAARRAVEQLTGKKPDDTTLYARENKPWLPAETDKLRELHEKAALEGGNLDSIAKEMGRTTTTIWNRMQRLGLGRLNRGRFEGNGVPRDLFAGERRPTREQLNARDEAAVQRLFGKGD